MTSTLNTKTNRKQKPMNKQNPIVTKPRLVEKIERCTGCGMIHCDCNDGWGKENPTDQWTVQAMDARNDFRNLQVEAYRRENKNQINSAQP